MTDDHDRRPLPTTGLGSWDTTTGLWSHVGNTEIVIGVCVVAVALIWWRTRRWWFALVPAIAIALQAAVSVLASRPRVTSAGERRR